jgi:hypothetical protein
MDFGKLIARVQAVLTTPKREWPIIGSEPASVAEIYKTYILVLAAVPAVAGLVKQSVIGTTVPVAGTVRVGFGAGLISMVLTYVLLLATIYIIALATNALAPKFGGQKDQVQALKVVAYAYTASFVASIGQLVPWLGLLIVLLGGIYGIYLFYLGLPHTMKCPQERAAVYTAAVVIIAIVLGVLLGGLVGVMTGFGTLPPPGQSEARVEQDGTMGKLESWSERMEAANKKLEAAQQSGNAEAEQEAMREMVGTVFGGQVETLPPDRLKAFLPKTLAGMNRSAFSAERQATMGLQISEADATYVDEAGNSLKLEITDLGGANAIMAFASWAAVERERETDDGYEKSSKQGERVLHERWNRETSSGEYGVLLAQRFLVNVSGKRRDIEELKAAVDELSLNELEALRNEGSRAN